MRKVRYGCVKKKSNARTLAAIAAIEGPKPNIVPAIVTGRTKINVRAGAGTTELATKARKPAAATKNNAMKYRAVGGSGGSAVASVWARADLTPNPACSIAPSERLR